jgi:DNA-binding PadR family transcriptional regulator
MARSPSTQWSASAGAIYPLTRRLQRAGLLTSAIARTGRRQRREYRITAVGKRVLRQWIGPPLSQEAVTVSHDPLRTRARFLGLLDPADRKAWVAAALRALDEVERQVRIWAKEVGDPDDPFAACLTHSGKLDVAGRRRWLGYVGKAAR